MGCEEALFGCLPRSDEDDRDPLQLFSKRFRKENSAKFALKPSEKSRRYPKRGPTRHLNRLVRPVLAPIDGPNTRPERHPHPFSDSFLTEFHEVRLRWHLRNRRSTYVSCLRSITMPGCDRKGKPAARRGRKGTDL